MNKYRKALREALREDMAAWNDLDKYTFEEEQDTFNPRPKAKRLPGEGFDELFEASMDFHQRMQKAQRIADEFGVESSVAEFYCEAASAVGDVKDFADIVYAADDDEDSEFYCEVAIPYAELKELYKAIKESKPKTRRSIREWSDELEDESRENADYESSMAAFSVGREKERKENDKKKIKEADIDEPSYRNRGNFFKNDDFYSKETLKAADDKYETEMRDIFGPGYDSEIAASKKRMGMKESVSYEDVVEMTGDDNEGNNVCDAYLNDLIAYDDALNILTMELGYDVESAEHWLDAAKYDQTVEEDEAWGDDELEESYNPRTNSFDSDDIKVDVGSTYDPKTNSMTSGKATAKWKDRTPDGRNVYEVDEENVCAF